MGCSASSQNLSIKTSLLNPNKQKTDDYKIITVSKNSSKKVVQNGFLKGYEYENDERKIDYEILLSNKSKQSNFTFNFKVK